MFGLGQQILQQRQMTNSELIAPPLGVIRRLFDHGRLYAPAGSIANMGLLRIRERFAAWPWPFTAPSSAPHCSQVPATSWLGCDARNLGRGASVYYVTLVVEVRQTPAFAQWLHGLRDRAAVARINVRIRRLSLGNPATYVPLGRGVSELRIDYGPGYRIYFLHRGPETVLLLCGGDKTTQDRDIGRAKELAKEDRDGS
jgi:putative addiction module killer protein